MPNPFKMQSSHAAGASPGDGSATGPKPTATDAIARDVSRMVVLAVTYCLLAWVSHQVAYSGNRVPLVWFGPAIGLVALVTFGLRLVPGIVVGSLAAHLLVGWTLQIAVAAACADAAAALVGAWLVTRLAPFDPRLERFRDVVAVIFGAGLAACTIPASAAVVAMVTTGAITPEAASSMWFAWWAACAQGVLVGAPLAFTWLARPSADRDAAGAILVGAAMGMGLVLAPAVLQAELGARVAHEVVLFALFPLALALAMRFAPREIAIFNGFIATAAVVGHITGIARIPGESMVGTLVVLHGFIAFFVITTLAFSAINLERRRATGALSESEARFRSLTEMGNDWYWEYGADLRFSVVSNGVNATGLEPNSFAGRALWELPFEVPDPILRAHQQILAANRRFRDFLIRRTMPTGEIRSFLVSGDPVFDKVGVFAGYRGVGREISTEKWAEEALRESEQRYASIFHSSAAAIIVFGVGEDGALRFESCNATGEAMLETRAQALLGFRLHDCLPPAVAEALDARLQATVQSDSRFTEELDLDFPSGTRRLVVTSVPVRRVAGRTERVQLIAIDLTEQMRATERARESEELFTHVFHSSPQAMAFWRLEDHKLTEVNAAWERLFGLKRTTALGYSSVELGLVKNLERREESIAMLREGRAVKSQDLTVHNAQGEEFLVLHSSAPMLLNGEWIAASNFVDVTERRRAEEALRRSEESFAKIFHSSPVPMLIATFPGLRNVEVNAAWAQLFGFERDEVIGKSALDIGSWIGPADFNEAVQALTQARTLRNAEARLKKRSNEIVDVLASAELVTIAGEQRVVASFIDISERKKTERQLRESERRFRDFAQAAGEYVWETDFERRLTFVSQRMEQVLGYSPEEVLGRRVLEFMAPGEEERVREWLTDRPRSEEEFRSLELRAFAKSGAAVWLQMSAVPIHDQDGVLKGWRGTAQDISERKRAEQRIEDLATRDPLTGLPNRLLLQDRLQQGIANASRAGEMLAVLFVDLDHFKRVNDTFGHSIGDGLLREVARRLANVIRKGDTLARLGGDEFLIVLEALKSSVDAGQVAQKILNSLTQPYEIDGHRFSTAGSVGVALFPSDGTDVASLMRQADTAMYAAKARGRGNFQFFSAEMNSRAIARVKLESDLRRGVERGEFRLYFQPRVALETGVITGIEALLRWRHPEDGLVTPERFIQVADETGVIQTLGPWVLDTAIAQAKAWTVRAAPAMRISVNVSARQFGPDLADQVREALLCHALDPTMLELEVTEATLMRNIEESAAIVSALRAVGCRIVVDDFGTGYSSTQYLRRLAVTGVKIDRSLVENLASGTDERAVVRAIVEMARTLGFEVAAEGVETAAQLAVLREIGCTEYLGNYFLPPVPAIELERHLFDGANVATLAAHRIGAQPRSGT